MTPLRAASLARGTALTYAGDTVRAWGTVRFGNHEVFPISRGRGAMSVSDVQDRRSSRRATFWLAAMMAISLIATLIGFTAPERAAAIAGNDFNIVSDAVFYNSSTMDVPQIQSFLNAKRPNCAPGKTCLKDYADSFSDRAANSRCGYLKGQRMSAAAIIYWVARACEINPQSLLVLLEKEQGLVSASAPSATAYRIAMGYGCPDTAPCDSLYYGFFNQVYNAARQFKIYQDSPSSFRYRAGRFNDIQWHPNAGCGSSSVYIENSATAGLYNYTPYRPNGASLGNLYGTGDGCSSYGNRNFWRIFSDWFGTTQSGSDFVRTASDARIYLLVGTTRHYVPSSEVFAALAPLGGYRTVSDAYLATFTEGKVASELVRDPATGETALAQAGQRHRFTSCDAIATFGWTCADAVDLAPSQFARFPRGGEISPYFRAGTTATVYTLVGGAKVRFTSIEALDAYAGGRPSYIASMRPAVAARYPGGRALMAPLSLVKASDSPTVYLVDGWERKVPISSFAAAGELGVSGLRVEERAVIDSYVTAPAPLSFLIRCGGALFAAASGVITRVDSGDPAQLRASDVSQDTCDRVRKSPSTITGPIFVKTADSAVVSLLTRGELRAIPAYAALVALNAGSVPALVQVSATTESTVPRGNPLLSPATLVKSAADPRVYLVDGLDRRIPVSTFAVPSEFGITGWSTVPDNVLSGYAPTQGTVSSVWACGGQQYFGASGILYPIREDSATGLPVTTVSASTCAARSRSSEPALARVFVISSDSPTVYLVQGGQARPVSTWSGLVDANGGASPRILPVAQSTIASLPAGPRIP